MTVVRRVVPLLLVPLALIACALASSPWLRAFPSGVLAVPLFGAAVLSVLIPVVVVGIGVRRLWMTALIDVVLFVFYELLVALREPGGFPDLYAGLVHGPAKILSFALPLVSPRTLLVAPVALCWVGGAILGECVARGWRTVVPYPALLAVFGLAYAGSVRAVSSASDGRRYDTVLAAALLVTLLLLRAAATWVAQDESADATQPGGALPLRSLAIGMVGALVVGAGTVGLAQTSAFSGPPHMPARTPPLDRTAPLTPLSFVSGLRPADPRSAGRPVFTVVTDEPSSAYVAIADVDSYDGDGWSFERTFRPSGGVVPGAAGGANPRTTAQQYTVASGPITGTPWMPYVDRPRRVSGLSIDVDALSGMIVPATRLHAGDRYTVQSAVVTTPFGALPASSTPTGYSPANLQLPGPRVEGPLGLLVDSLAAETGTPKDERIAFLQAVTQDFRTHYGLAGGPAPRPTVTPTGSAGSSSSASRSSGLPSPSVLSTPSGAQRAGGTSFADVLASIRQFRSATPEQYATLMCLLARTLSIPSRVATGFRLTRSPAAATLPAGRHTVTTAQAWTWVEVDIQGRGWVVLDAAPSQYSGQRPPQTNGATPSPTPSASASANASISVASSGRPPAQPAQVPGRRAGSSVSLLMLALIAVAVLLVLLLAFLLLRKRVRAGRRRRGPPRASLLGAWRETLDVLEESGLPPLRAATGREVAAATEARFGPEPARAARQLGDAANAAIFRPGAPVSDEDAAAAWATHGTLARAVRRSLGRRARWRAALRYHRADTDRPEAGPGSWADVHGDVADDPRRHRPTHR